MSELLWYGFQFSGRSEREVSLFEPVPEGETLYLTKKPPDTSRIRHAFLADERLFAICMLRDPRSVASSRHKKYPDVYFSDFRRWLEYEKEIRQLAEHPRFLLVRYEALLTDPDAIQQEILSKFPLLKLQRRFSEYPAGADPGERAHIAMHSVRALDPGRIEGWREHLPRVKDQLIRYPQINRTQLFDLQSDPHETRDLSADAGQAARIKKMTAELARWQEALGDSQPLTSEKPANAAWTPPNDKK